MSLIDAKHLAAPFQNMTHVIMIVLVSFLFVAWRWGGSSIEFRGMQGGVPVVKASDEQVPDTTPARVLVPDLSQPRVIKPPGRTAEDDMLAEFVAKTEGEPPTPRGGRNAALEDIERQLGLK